MGPVNLGNVGVMRKVGQLMAVIAAAFLALLAALFAFGAPAFAAAITVDDLSNTDGGGTCTLRNAITAANTNAAVGGCPAGTAGLDTIHFSVTGTVHIGVALPALTEDVTIDGPGADTLTISVDDVLDNVFVINSGATIGIT